MSRIPDPGLVESIDALLPQTQCRRCGEHGCRPYAEAIARGKAPINRCPPGGESTVVALARLLQTAVLPLDATRGPPTPFELARIDEPACIGCALCLRACPTDAIVGAKGQMHTVLADRCTGCGLCLPPCPVDCIAMRPAGRAWTSVDAAAARARHATRNARLAHSARSRSELEYQTPFELLVSVVLSAQATDKGVNLATARLYPHANTPEAILALGEEGLIPYIRTIGLFRTKARNIIALCRQLLAEHGGQVPADLAALVKLPGVGRKTANVVLNVAFGQPTIAVDTHIFRVANRTGLAPGKTPDAVEAGLVKFTPLEFRHDAHHWLILHGRYTCLARTPRCPQCIIEDLCEYRHKTNAAAQDAPRRRAAKSPARTRRR